ncbi:hypothetical protein N7491_006304 [Penicillium cf. griseofulvum]|nr:hypothetical protein N7491_006304 [Penicillium cf. griseofulvum]
MKFLGFAVAFLPLLAAAAPVADPEPGADGELDLEKRASAQTCKIVNVDHYVNCRYDATLDAGEIFGFPKEINSPLRAGSMAIASMGFAPGIKLHT